MGYSIDGPTKVITLTAGTVSVSVRDLWSRWVDWFLTGDNSKYLPAFEFVGGNDIDLSAGTYIPIYAFLKNGWKIKPQEAHHTLSIRDGILLVDGGGDPFRNTDGAYIVRINFQQPVQAISFATGGGGGGGGGATAQEVWEYTERSLTALGIVAIQNGLATDAKLELVKLKTDTLPVGIKKNVALDNFTFLMTNSSSHNPMTGLSVTGFKSIDGGAFGPCENPVTEIANGIYKISLSADDMNGNTITLRFLAVGADDKFITIVTES